jgi:hypothetical protein
VAINDQARAASVKAHEAGESDQGDLSTNIQIIGSQLIFAISLLHRSSH